MALLDNAWYVNGGDGSTTGHYAVTPWSNKTAAAGEIIRPTYAGTVTMTIASPCVVTWPVTHNFVVGDAVVFTTTGALPTGVTAGTTYYCVATIAATTFSIAATPGGTAINTSGTQSGVHTGTGCAVGRERCFVCTTAGATGATEPVWTITRGALNTSSSAVYQECTGVAALNGDASANTPTWTAYRTSTATATLGQVIQRDNGASFWICTVGGTMSSLGSEPAWADNNAGTTRTDNSATWTCLGVVGNFTGWQAPHARLENAYVATWGVVGNKFFIASEHNSVQGLALTATNPGTLASPCYVYCVTKTTIPPVSANLTTGAIISTTGANNISLAGVCAFYYGITFKVGSGNGSPTLNVNSTQSSKTTFINCLFTVNTTGASSRISLSSSSSQLTELNNCTFTFGSSTSQGFSASSTGTVLMNGGTIVVGANIPNNLFIIPPANFIANGVDFSALGSGKTILGASTTSGLNILKNCKLGASVTKSATPTTSQQKCIIQLSDSSATNYLVEQYTYYGTQTVETTIVRTGGATDGTQAVAWKIITTANSKWVMPFETLPFPVWNDTTASNVTVTVYGIWGGGAVPNNDDIWIEASYMGSSSTPIATIVNSSKADNLATGSALSSDSSTWGGSTTKFKMSLTFSSPQPAMKGLIYVTVKAALASSTFYIDPKIVLS